MSSLYSILVFFIAVLYSAATETEKTFTLRHVHAAHSESGRIRWADVPQLATASGKYYGPSSSYVLHAKRIKLRKPFSQAAFHAVRENSRQQRSQLIFGSRHNHGQSLGWQEDDVQGPAIDKRETLLTLAKMTNNAYFHKNERGWYDLGGNWTSDHNIGWDPEVDGFRGHVFLSADNSTVVLSIKGTSAGVFGGTRTIEKDRLNDNLLFSCCCAKVDWTWGGVCGCYSGGNRCDQSCLEESLADESLFYHVGINLYNNLTFMYPDAQIWITGHSLGGALASLIGLTFGAPVVAFEAVPERLAAQRLHLPMPPSTQHITHVYNNADPIAMGTCNGVSSVCYAGGYALETKCRIGQTILYDTVGALHWSVNLQAHFITTITEHLLNEDWSVKARKGRRPWWRLPGLPGFPGYPDDHDERIEVPEPSEDGQCEDCGNWEFGEYLAKPVGA
ncbi:Lipase (class 3) [Ceratobasidium sp. AG-Ba]|nr:Lipase (class 3) [Ceratobasidium sp. AG-Ba]QRW04685.1 Lipase (class 3) [Ceratobasidium sp. AG-Ba]